MHIVLYSKPVVQGYLRPLAHKFARLGITPNQVTVTNILVSLGASTIVLLNLDELWPLFFIPFALTVRFILNHVDGILACDFNMQSAKGLILNELGDIISDVVLYLPLALINVFSPMLVVVMVVLAMLTEFTGILGAVIGADRSQDGPLGKRPRGVLIGSAAFLLGLGMTPGIWANILLMAMLPLLVITCINRVIISLEQLNASQGA